MAGLQVFTRRQEEEEMGSVLENGDSATLTAESCIGHSPATDLDKRALLFDLVVQLTADLVL
jgi:hypothetical protein